MFCGVMHKTLYRYNTAPHLVVWLMLLAANGSIDVVPLLQK